MNVSDLVVSTVREESTQRLAELDQILPHLLKLGMGVAIEDLHGLLPHRGEHMVIVPGSLLRSLEQQMDVHVPPAPTPRRIYTPEPGVFLSSITEPVSPLGKEYTFPNRNETLWDCT